MDNHWYRTQLCVDNNSGCNNEVNVSNKSVHAIFVVEKTEDVFIIASSYMVCFINVIRIPLCQYSCYCH